MSAIDILAIQAPLDYSDSGPGAVIVFSILSFFTTTVVILRFLAKRLTRQTLGADDWLCLAALLIHHAFMIASCVGVVQGGMRRDVRITAVENPNSVVIFFQCLFIAEVAYTYSSPLVKLSVLAFYWRIFPTSGMKLGCKIIGAMCIAWCIAVSILDFVQCRPLKAFWYLELRALPTTRCVDTVLHFLANSIANAFIDFLTISLPIYEVCKLHTSTERKFKVAFVFLLGGIALAASLVRTATTNVIWRKGLGNFTSKSNRKSLFASNLWSQAWRPYIEIYVAIIGACTPTLMPFYRKLRYGEYTASQTGVCSSKHTLGISVNGGIVSGKRVSRNGPQLSESTGSFLRLEEEARVGQSTHDDDGFGYPHNESYELDSVRLNRV
ncbi:unnamed protein product [Clonostachys chloroleuca]|uniref:Rhodopsin domain-containing protein n=1 Tax=Clonostachys chloroleuca TaxID=1926264 RepID=A0AA35Q8L8_9HYPO|nr:unnamed protein product [Clonostachys chloroleuca]